ncbi:MAG TPA: RagB/SusD family nutrient uptake outer membrane protein [Candidatus Barnesiella excrementavium]|nr:RagB/SusD family nutrient uptake outer membrane protein [Candidatus Barnesiella excrementavium]
MKVLKYILPICFLGGLISSCDMLEPDLDNTYDQDRVKSDPAFAEGLLLQAYEALPQGYTFDEVATDDAVTNDKNSDYLSMATGSWSALSNPMETWSDSYNMIGYLNDFLSVVDQIEWSWESERRDQLFRDRYKGEALALRAYFHFQILQAHGGKGASGQMLGIPYIKTLINASNSEEWMLERPAYKETVTDIFNDLDSAITLLPEVYDNISGDDDYNRVNGEDHVNRISGLIAHAIKARVALHAASPAFNGGRYDMELGQIAAEESAYLINYIGKVSALTSALKDPYFFDANSDTKNKDILWRMDYQKNTYDRESDNYPPSLFGNGRVNPSQNFVDIFPMENGYPIGSEFADVSGYNEADPYWGRDPRLANLVLYNGGTIGSTQIFTSDTEGNIDGLDKQTNSTRTGYYLKKLMRPDVNLSPASITGQTHVRPLIRYTEMFLIYAEIANELWGADADPQGYGFTPRSIIAGIRKRAKILSEGTGDAYLNTLDTEGLKSLIRNERRIELSFEGFRFWDMRRWGLPMDETIRGMKIIDRDGVLEYSVIENVENRNYASYMQYGPIPQEQILKCGVLEQNQGW